jgi:hypothetical protein
MVRTEKTDWTWLDNAQQGALNPVEPLGARRYHVTGPGDALPFKRE